MNLYADTECFLKRVNSDEGEYTIKYQEHQPNSIGAKLVSIDDRFTLYRSKKPKKQLYKSLIDII